MCFGQKGMKQIEYRYMNHWTQLSIEYANQKSYLDDLFHVYPTIPDGIRDLDGELWKKVEKAFEKRDNAILLENLLKMDLFPIKDSYVAYLKRDKTSLKRNPATVDRLCGRLYEMGIFRNVIQDILDGTRQYGCSLESLERFCMPFAILARTRETAQAA